MIILILIAILACLGIGVFALLNWQTVAVVWAQSIVFVFGCLSFILVGTLIVILIEFIKESKD